MADGVSIAMWSGPRNISTAMMYSFDNRRDCFAIDEPLYAHYLAQTGTQHPDSEKVIAHYESNSAKVAEYLTGDIPEGASIWYQKHMCHHILPGMDTDWLDSLTNCFLLRDPREVLLSLARVTEEVTLWSTGLPQQVRLMEQVAKSSGQIPPILDTRDILDNPEGMLGLLCDEIGVDFSDRMLSWKAGPRKCDGIWGEHWYDSVWSSTGFAPFRPRHGELAPDHELVLEQATPLYDSMHRLRMTL